MVPPDHAPLRGHPPLELRVVGLQLNGVGSPAHDRDRVARGQVARIVGASGAANLSGVRWADIELSGGQVLELIEYIDPRGAPSRPAANDPGATHISLRVGDIEAIHGRLRQAGVPVRTDPIELTAPGAWQGARCFYASDPDGVTVELIQV